MHIDNESHSHFSANSQREDGFSTSSSPWEGKILPAQWEMMEICDSIAAAAAAAESN
jgi:hypothetical protein